MPRVKKNKPTSRLNFEGVSLQVSESARDRLERLRDATDADSLSEVVRRALAVYDTLWEQHSKGADTIVRYPDGKERELLLV